MTAVRIPAGMVELYISVVRSARVAPCSLVRTSSPPASSTMSAGSFPVISHHALAHDSGNIPIAMARAILG
jgi:hypothetical protein